MTIPLSSITVSNRGRSDKKLGDIKALAESIKNVGMIQPIVLSRNGSAFDLVAGGRRFRAISSLGITELQHGVTLQPGIASFVFADEVPEHHRKEAELDENLHRLDMDWLENCLMVADIHKLKSELPLPTKGKAKKWGTAQTAAILGKGYGASNVGYALRIAAAARAGDKEILKAASLNDALAILLRRKEENALAELQRRNAAKLASAPKPAPSSSLDSTKSFLSSFALDMGPAAKAPAPSSDSTAKAVSMLENLGIKPAKPETVKKPPVEIPLSHMFKHADQRQIVWPTVDHVVTDIPYGIDMSNLDPTQVATVAAEHDVEENVGMMEGFLQKAFAAVKPGGFCVFFYDLDHHEKLQGWARAAGWKVQRWPFIACKTSVAQNNAAQFNTTKNYEVAMILRKDEQSVLRKAQGTSWKPYDFAAERKLYANPFAKPFALWKDLYDMIAFSGQTVLDPFAGEMSACRAAINCGLIPYGIEINEHHYNRGIEHVKAAYAVVHNGNVEFT